MTISSIWVDSLELGTVQAQLFQMAQTAGCNGKHDMQQRLARWLLLCADRTGTSSLPVSQEFLGMMLGVLRMSAAMAISQFRESGLDDHQRGAVTIIGAEGLQARSCEGYLAGKRYITRLHRVRPGFLELTDVASLADE